MPRNRWNKINSKTSRISETGEVIRSSSSKNESALFRKMVSIITEQLGVDDSEVTQSTSFVDDLGADSLDTVELVMTFEEEFEIEIPDEDAERMLSVNDAYRYLMEHRI